MRVFGRIDWKADDLSVLILQLVSGHLDFFALTFFFFCALMSDFFFFFNACMCVLCLHVSMLSRPRLSPWLKINTAVFLKVINLRAMPLRRRCR